MLFLCRVGPSSTHVALPTLCYVDDEMEAVVVCDTTRHTLHTISYKARVGDINLPRFITTPHGARQDAEGDVFLLEFSPHRIVKLKAV